MADYTKLTDFASKDALPTGNAAKIVKGTEIDDEFAAIQNAIVTKADAGSPALSGTPTAPTAAAGTSDAQVATTAFVTTAITNIGVSLDDNWTVVETGTDLLFKYNGTSLMKLDASGNLTVTGNVTGFGTV